MQELKKLQKVEETLKETFLELDFKVDFSTHESTRRLEVNIAAGAEIIKSLKGIDAAFESYKTDAPDWLIKLIDKRELDKLDYFVELEKYEKL